MLSEKPKNWIQYCTKKISETKIPHLKNLYLLNKQIIKIMKNLKKVKNIILRKTVGLTSALITGLGFAAFRNVQKTAGIYEKYAESMENKIKQLIDKQESWDLENLDRVKKICVSMNFSKQK